jgi:hypothetical protein
VCSTRIRGNQFETFILACSILRVWTRFLRASCRQTRLLPCRASLQQPQRATPNSMEKQADLKHTTGREKTQENVYKSYCDRIVSKSNCRHLPKQHIDCQILRRQLRAHRAHSPNEPICQPKTKKKMGEKNGENKEKNQPCTCDSQKDTR